LKRRYFLVCAALLLLVVAATVLFWPQMPERVPVHWNAAGEVDRYGSRWELAIFGPAAIVVSMGVFAALPWLSPRRFPVEASGATYLRFMLLVVGMLGYVQIVLLWAAMGGVFDVTRAIFGGIGALIALMGNLLGKLRRNFYIGIRTPWTLASEANWYATHRFAGKLMVAGGSFALVAALLGLPWWAALTAVLVATLVPVPYSLWFSKRREKPEDGDRGRGEGRA